MKKHGKILLALLLILGISMLGGCGKNENSSDDQEKGGADSGVTATKNPSYGGSIVVGITQDLDSLDPHKAKAAGTEEVLFNIFEGIVKPDKDGNLVPAVASDVAISEDGMSYTFTLRDGVKFHNGTPVTAEDVVYSLKRYAGLLETVDPEVKVTSALSCISDITASEDESGKSKITLTLSEANTELLGYLTGAIIPKDYDKQADAPVGTGPFRFVSYTPLQSFVMEKNPDYYGDAAYLDKVTFKISADVDAAFLELLAGGIDVFPYLTSEQASQLTEKFNICVGTTNLVQALFLNHAEKPFDDIRVRQAMCHAINRQEILDMVADGKGSLIGSGMFAGFAKYFNADLVNTYNYDIEKAKELLTAAGYPDGFEMTITVPSNYQFHVDTAQVIVEQLKKVGVQAKIQLVEWGTWLSDTYRGRQFQTTIVGLDANLAPSDVLKRYRSTASSNFLTYNNAEFDEIFALAVAEADDAKKVAYYKQLQEILTNDAASVYIQDPASYVAVSKKLSGYTFYPVYVQDMSKIYYIETEQAK